MQRKMKIRSQKILPAFADQNASNSLFTKRDSKNWLSAKKALAAQKIQTKTRTKLKANF